MTKEVIRDFVVESKGHCFLCLDSITTSETKQEDDHPSLSKLYSLHSLQYLARYLRLDMRKVFIEEGAIPSNLLANVKRSKLKVELCCQCSNLSDKFSGLYRQLEWIELEVLSSLQNIYRKLLKGNEIQAECRLPHLTESSQEWVAKLDIMEALRGDAIRKCEKKLRSAMPRVKVQKLTRKEKIKFTGSSKSIHFSEHDDISKEGYCRDDDEGQSTSSLSSLELEDAEDMPSPNPVKIEYDNGNIILDLDNGQDHRHSSAAEIKKVIKIEHMDLPDNRRNGAEEWTPSNRVINDSDSSMDSLSEDDDSEYDSGSGNNQRLKNMKTGGKTILKRNKRKRTSRGKVESVIEKQNPDSPSNFRLKCPDCGLLFRDIKGILLHRKDCESCAASYDPESSVKIEILVPEDNTSKNPVYSKVFAVMELPQAIFLCEECGQAVYSSEDILEHQKLHGSFPCKFCNVVEAFAPNLATHELKHAKMEKRNGVRTNVPTDYLSCARCDFVFQDKGASIRNIYIVHHLKEHLFLTLNEPKCSICKTSSNKLRDQDLAQHFKSRHDLTNVSKQNIKSCTVANCNAYFLTAHQLSVHLRLRHQLTDSLRKAVINRHKCQDCEKSFALPHSLRRHRLRYHILSDTVIPCSFKKCSKVFESKEELDWHIQYSSTFHKSLDSRRNKSKTQVKCPLCKKLICGSDPRYLKVHMNIHTSSKKSKFSCDVCGKEFKENYRLQEHSLVHEGPASWKFVCDICSKMCVSQSKLKVHMRIHTKETPYVCEICGVKYGYARSLRAHMRSKHK